MNVTMIRQMCRQDTKAVPTALTGALGSKNTSILYRPINIMETIYLFRRIIRIQVSLWFLIMRVVYSCIILWAHE